MALFSAIDGKPTQFHFVHYGARAIGGVGLIILEATAVDPHGIMTSGDLGLWRNDQVEALKPIVDFIISQDVVPVIQLAHAGRKAGLSLPWEENRSFKTSDAGWTPVAPSPLPFTPEHTTPKSLTNSEIEQIVEAWSMAAKRAQFAGFQALELHMAHGYLIHEFLSPLTNKRKDDYGGSLDNRMRFPLKVVEAVRSEWLSDMPLFVRISATDWVPGGWDIDQSIRFARELDERGVDLVDCSSGGIFMDVDKPEEPGYQVIFSDRIRKEVGIHTAAVGMITDPDQAEEIIHNGQADVVLLGRELLRQPHWALKAAEVLGQECGWVKQYLRANQN